MRRSPHCGRSRSAAALLSGAQTHSQQGRTDVRQVLAAYVGALHGVLPERIAGEDAMLGRPSGTLLSDCLCRATGAVYQPSISDIQAACTDHANCAASVCARPNPVVYELERSATLVSNVYGSDSGGGRVLRGGTCAAENARTCHVELTRATATWRETSRAN